MSLLKQRLNRLKQTPAEKIKPTPPKSKVDWSQIGAEILSQEFGSFVVRKRIFPLTHPHGYYALGDLIQNIQELQPLIPNANTLEVSIEQYLFFDTETTGLGLGAGNVPFMIGLGYYTCTDFVVEQLFIRNPSEELAMLTYLQDILSKHSILVSYNGKSFDWPILKNRLVLNRFDLMEDTLSHLDLLYPARSLWKQTLDSCRLGNVEEKRLGFERVNDIPGSLAPTYYFQFLAEEDIQLIAGVFQHNEWDILSLATLAIHFSYILSEQYPLASLEDEELYRLGLWLDRVGRWPSAKDAFSMFLNMTERTKNGPYFYAIASHYKKRGEIATAITIWDQLIQDEDKERSLSIEPFIELAKYYEHHEKNIAKALEYAEEALLRAWRRSSLTKSHNRYDDYAAIKKRIQRLQAKLSIQNTNDQKECPR